MRVSRSPVGISRSKGSIKSSLVVSLKLFTILFGIELFCMCPFLFFVLLVLLTGFLSQELPTFDMTLYWLVMILSCHSILVLLQ